jgi:hypothetical protein
MFLSRTRARDLRLRTIICCRRTKFSASNLARDLNRSSSQIRIAPIAGSISAPSTAGHSGQGFDQPQGLCLRVTEPFVVNLLIIAVFAQGQESAIDSPSQGAVQLKAESDRRDVNFRTDQLDAAFSFVRRII